MAKRLHKERTVALVAVFQHAAEDPGRRVGAGGGRDGASGADGRGPGSVGARPAAVLPQGRQQNQSGLH